MSDDPLHDTYPLHFLDSPFMNGYVEGLLWSSVDADPEDDSDDPEMVNLDEYPESYALRYLLVADAWDFYSAWHEVWREAGVSDDYAGHDFALTRNHCGVGFWDRGLGEVGKILTEACEAFGTVEPYLMQTANGWQVFA